MKLVKSLLLGSAAGIAAVAGAQAADLPSRKAAPVEYVRVCSAYGAGFFYIPGTDTCLRIGGRVRAEYTFGERWSFGQDSYGTRARGRLNIDARTATAYGTLRTFIRYEMTSQSGSYNYSGTNAGANRFSLVSGSQTQSSPNLDKAFIQFGPITAGKAQSFFDFYANDFGFSVLRTSDRSPNLLAYTATFGGGFSATISAEDSLTSGRLGTLAGTYQGQVMPDIVASLRVDQGWGSAQLSGVVSNRSVGNVFTGVKSDEWGYAIQGGVKINLPMLAAGDQLWLQAGYADGAVNYLGWGSTVGYGRLGAVAVSDFGLDAFGNIQSTTGYNIVAAFRHFWTPTLRTDIIGSYSELETANGLDPKEFIAGANLVWSPVSGLDIGVEVLYSRMELATRVLDAKNVALGAPAKLIKSDDAWAGRLRIQRDF